MPVQVTVRHFIGEREGSRALAGSVIGIHLPRLAVVDVRDAPPVNGFVVDERKLAVRELCHAGGPCLAFAIELREGILFEVVEVDLGLFAGGMLQHDPVIGDEFRRQDKTLHIEWLRRIGARQIDLQCRALTRFLRDAAAEAKGKHQRCNGE